MKLAQIFFCTTLLLITLVTKGQNNNVSQDQIVKASFWNKTNPDLQDNTIPEKWKDESAVILYRSIDYRLDRPIAIGGLNEDYYFHERVKILDDYAVNEYSEFSWPENLKAKRLFKVGEIKYYVGYKIIKPNGQEIEISLDELVKKSIKQERETFEYNKIAIPNIAPGDIIDRYIGIEKIHKAYKIYPFDPEYYEMVGEFPIKKQKIKVRINKNFYLNAKSINGAPKLKKTKDEFGYIEFVLSDTIHRNKLQKTEWINFSSEIPMLKIQAFYSKNDYAINSNFSTQFLGDLVPLKSSLDISKLENITSSFIARYISTFETMITKVYDVYQPYIKSTLKYTKKQHPNKNLDKYQMAREAFYFLREYDFRRDFEGDNSIFKSSYRKDLDLVGFIHTLAAVYKKRKIKYDVLYTTPNTQSRLDDWLFVSELYPCLRVNEKDTFYITSLEKNNLVNEIPYYLQGNKAYEVNPYSDPYSYSSISKVSNTEIRKTTYQENTTTINISLKIDANNSINNAKLNFKVTGNAKADFDTVITSNDLLNDTCSKYYSHINKYHNKFGETTVIKRKIQIKDFAEQEKRNEFLVNYINKKTDFSITEISDFKMISTGKWEKKPCLEFSFSIPLENQTINTEEGILFSSGNLLVENNKISHLDSVREYNIFTKYPYVINQILTINMPTGYELKNTNSLDTQINNDVGFFRLKTECVGNNVQVITAEKINIPDIPATSWNSFKEIKTAAYDIKSQQLLIGKAAKK